MLFSGLKDRNYVRRHRPPCCWVRLVGLLPLLVHLQSPYSLRFTFRLAVLNTATAVSLSLGPRHSPSERDGWPLLPEGTVTHLCWYVPPFRFAMF